MSFSVSAGAEDWAIMLMVAILLGGLYWLLRTHRLAQAAHHWHAVKATLLEVHIKTRTYEDRGEESAPHIKYRYRFRQREFISKRLQYGDLWSSDYAESCAMIHGLHPGDEISVLVNPRNPKQVVVFPGYGGHLISEVLLLVTVSLVLLLML
jgi:hypothetical protein